MITNTFIPTFRHRHLDDEDDARDELRHEDCHKDHLLLLQYHVAVQEQYPHIKHVGSENEKACEKYEGEKGSNSLPHNELC